MFDGFSLSKLSRTFMPEIIIKSQCWCLLHQTVAAASGSGKKTMASSLDDDEEMLILESEKQNPTMTMTMRLRRLGGLDGSLHLVEVDLAAGSTETPISAAHS